MKRYVALGLLIATTLACSKGEEAATQAPAAEAADSEATTDEARLPGTIYKKALEQAQKEITADNAVERLNDLERQIDLERQSL
jgi:hypothetical protein